VFLQVYIPEESNTLNWLGDLIWRNISLHSYTAIFYSVKASNPIEPQSVSEGIRSIMRETVTIQVGQCGNAIGTQFWNLLLKEHEKTPDTDDSLSAFFRFSPRGSSDQMDLKARALLIDMECGPLQETMRSPLGSLFDTTQFVMDVSGSGNNFAHGHYMYGPKYRSAFEEGLRKNAEHCDSLQTFLVTHSLGGGTGSGVGSYVVGLLEDLYPEIYRFSACVFPSEENDVVTSPYNSVLSTNALLNHADCVLPIDNAALQSFAQMEAQQRDKAKAGPFSSGSNKKDDSGSQYEKEKGFLEMNAVAARMLCHLTASSRFHGEMNVDMNEICTNLVPFPRLKFLMSALSPHRAVARHAASNAQLAGKAALQRGFVDILGAPGQLTSARLDREGSVTLACAFLARGNVVLSDFVGCVTTAQSKSLRFPSWNEDATKIGMCSVSAPDQKISVLGVYNNTAFGSVLTREHNRFNTLFKRRAMLHHYTEFVDAGVIADAEANVAAAVHDYEAVEREQGLGIEYEEAYEGLYGNIESVLMQERIAARNNDIDLFPAF
jgi:tubulin epsilon